MANLSVDEYPLALNKYQEASAIEGNIAQNASINLQEKTAMLQERIDSAYYTLIGNGDFFAELGTEHGKKQAIENYEKALRLKESELVQLKLNKLKSIAE